jgi:hypothetical protein
VITTRPISWRSEFSDAASSFDATRSVGNSGVTYGRNETPVSGQTRSRVSEVRAP